MVLCRSVVHANTYILILICQSKFSICNLSGVEMLLRTVEILLQLFGVHKVVITTKKPNSKYFKSFNLVAA